MKVRVFKLFGREVLRIETHEEASLADVISALIAQRIEAATGVVECECCGEEFDPEEEEMRAKFIDMTEKIVWDSKADDYEDPDISDE
jgi:hypothetical protein